MKLLSLGVVMMGACVRLVSAQSCTGVGNIQNATNPSSPLIRDCVEVFKNIECLIDPAAVVWGIPTFLGSITTDGPSYRNTIGDCTFDMRASSGEVQVEAGQVLTLIGKSIDDYNVTLEGETEPRVETSGDLWCNEGTASARWWIYNVTAAAASS